MNFRGLNIILIILSLLVGAFSGQILFNSSVELVLKFFVVVFSIFFASECAILNELLDDWEFERWKRRLGYV